mmetsp:Transcript_136783/g.341067  ORF Transcript_136783/g.341067 Transcript_136783/m.341067 type:complete len:217 (+) Transcript_136783:1739-2389(+)
MPSNRRAPCLRHSTKCFRISSRCSGRTPGGLTKLLVMLPVGAAVAVLAVLRLLATRPNAVDTWAAADALRLSASLPLSPNRRPGVTAPLTGVAGSGASASGAAAVPVFGSPVPLPFARLPHAITSRTMVTASTVTYLCAELSPEVLQFGPLAAPAPFQVYCLRPNTLVPYSSTQATRCHSQSACVALCTVRTPAPKADSRKALQEGWSLQGKAGPS